MAANSLFEQLFFPGFLEDIILDRVHKVLHENTKQVEEKKDLEIEAREVRCTVLEENLVKANNKIESLETAQAQAVNKIASLESAQLKVAQYNTEVLDLFGKLHQQFPWMYPSAPASASSMIAPDSSFNFIHMRAPKATTPKNTIESAFESKSEPARTTENESKLAPLVSKKTMKRERERTKKDEEKRKKDGAATTKKLGEDEVQAVEDAAVGALTAEDAAVEQAVEEEAINKTDKEATTIAKREEKKVEEDSEVGWGLRVKVQRRKESEIKKVGGKEAASVTETPTPANEMAACSAAEEVGEKEIEKAAPKVAGFGRTGGSAWGTAAITDRKDANDSDGWTPGGKKRGGVGGFSWGSGKTW